MEDIVSLRCDLRRYLSRPLDELGVEGLFAHFSGFCGLLCKFCKFCFGKFTNFEKIRRK